MGQFREYQNEKRETAVRLTARVPNPYTLILKRFLSNKFATCGVLLHDNNFICYTLELPYKNNERDISCIPAGEYKCLLKESPKFGLVYEVTNVPNRSNILIHVGNFLSDSTGCILVGLEQSIVSHKHVVLSSKDALKKLQDYTENRIDLTLEILNV